MCKSDRNSVVNELKEKTELIVMKTELFLKILKFVTQLAYTKSMLSEYKE